MARVSMAYRIACYLLSCALPIARRTGLCRLVHQRVIPHSHKQHANVQEIERIQQTSGFLGLALGRYASQKKCSAPAKRTRGPAARKNITASEQLDVYSMRRSARCRGLRHWAGSLGCCGRACCRSWRPARCAQASRATMLTTPQTAPGQSCV